MRHKRYAVVEHLHREDNKVKKTTLLLAILMAALTISTSIARAVDDVERDALMALYNSTNGPNWSFNNSGWGIGNPCDPTWYGVTCEANHVTELKLAGNGLSGAIPAALGNLGSLKSLWLFSNQLSGPIPAALGNLANLEELELYNNQLSGSIPDELGNLGNMQRLDLHNNQLSGPIPVKLGNLGSVTGLFLSDNQLSGPIPAALSNMNSLNWLWLIGNDGLVCWQTEAALIWAQDLDLYEGPDAVCNYPFAVYLPMMLLNSG